MGHDAIVFFYSATILVALMGFTLLAFAFCQIEDERRMRSDWRSGRMPKKIVQRKAKRNSFLGD